MQDFVHRVEDVLSCFADIVQARSADPETYGFADPPADSE